jgi:hypothetical protein
MNVTKTEERVPDLHDIDGIAAANVYIAKWNADHTVLNPDLPDGLHVVLRTDHDEKLELTTRHQISGVPTEEGTYLNAVDLATFNNIADPKVRLYTWNDTFAKVRSAAGVVLLLPAVLAVLTAVIGIFFLLSSQGQPSIATVGDRALAVVVWATQPGAARATQAQSCLLLIEGHQAPAVTIPGVICGPPTTPWWRSTLTGSLVTGGIAILTALVGIFALPSHYQFGKKPTSGS